MKTARKTGEIMFTCIRVLPHSGDLSSVKLFYLLRCLALCSNVVMVKVTKVMVKVSLVLLCIVEAACRQRLSV